MGQAEAQLALYKLTAILEAEGLPYAIIGAFALNAYGHRRVTVDVDLVMRDDHLQAFKRNHLGRGYVERVPGTGKLRFIAHSVERPACDHDVTVGTGERGRARRRVQRLGLTTGIAEPVRAEARLRRRSGDRTTRTRTDTDIRAGRFARADTGPRPRSRTLASAE